FTAAQKNLLEFSSSVIQKGGFLSVSTGDTVTLECSYMGADLTWIFWYKQTLGQRPEPISSFYAYGSILTFFDQFNNPRFSLDTKNQNHCLTISDLQFSDSATYYCAARHGNVLKFTEGVTVSVKGPGVTMKTSVDQSSSENIHAGDSVTLNCTVHTGSCDGEHRVYWFKVSEDSHPGLIYTDGGRNDQCERNNNTQTHSCVYELSMKNLNESHAGIYYCAVVSCGHILFGNGTKLNLTDSAAPLNSVILHTLVGLLTIMIVLVVFLLFLLWKMNKRNKCTSTDERSPAAPLSSIETENKDTESLHYAALNVKRSKKSRRQKNNSNTDCVYAGVRQQN
ncbi:Fc receptor-like protein 4, partial [Oryzias melastigma]|uniref:Fc receptor-like protein 4 n=1 Tax=Oryzias melastigma TaxID=30732 RepID=UPI00168CBA48